MTAALSAYGTDKAAILAEVSRMSSEERQAILAASVPRLVEPYVPHVPHPAQAVFLLHMEREVFYGGAGGGGKSDALLMAASQFCDVPGYSALILRRSFPDLTQAGAIMDRAEDWWRPTPAEKPGGSQGRTWYFPTIGAPARVTFGYVSRDADVEQYRGAEYQAILWDELTQFNEKPYRFLFSRLRGPALNCLHCNYSVTDALELDARGRPLPKRWRHDEGFEFAGRICPGAEPDRSQLQAAPDGTTLADVPIRMRGASNPGGSGHAWVRDRLVNPKTAIPGSVFVPAKLADNPSMNRAQYRSGLAEMTATDRARIEEGDWDAADEGTLFRREWFDIREDAPDPSRFSLCRFWDLAATAPKPGIDPDWTCGVLVGLDRLRGEWWILDAVHERTTPAGVQSLVIQTALADRMYCGYHMVRMEQEPGSSGVNTIAAYRIALVGYDFDSVRPTGSKGERARPLAVAAENGSVKMLAGDWNRWLLDELSAFPGGAHDDSVDSASGAFNSLANQRQVSVIL